MSRLARALSKAQAIFFQTTFGHQYLKYRLRYRKNRFIKLDWSACYDQATRNANRDIVITVDETVTVSLLNAPSSYYSDHDVLSFLSRVNEIDNKVQSFQEKNLRELLLTVGRLNASNCKECYQWYLQSIDFGESVIRLQYGKHVSHNGNLTDVKGFALFAEKKQNNWHIRHENNDTTQFLL